MTTEEKTIVNAEWNSAIKTARETAHIHTCDGCGDEVDEKIAALMRPAAPAVSDAEMLAKMKQALEFYANPFGKCDAVPDFYGELAFGDLAQEVLDQEKKR